MLCKSAHKCNTGDVKMRVSQYVHSQMTGCNLSPDLVGIYMYAICILS